MVVKNKEIELQGLILRFMTSYYDKRIGSFWDVFRRKIDKIKKNLEFIYDILKSIIFIINSDIYLNIINIFIYK